MSCHKQKASLATPTLLPQKTRNRGHVVPAAIGGGGGAVESSSIAGTGGMRGLGQIELWGFKTGITWCGNKLHSVTML